MTYKKSVLNSIRNMCKKDIVMYRDYEREQQTITEIRELVKDIENAKENMTMYCEIMKDIFLSGSGKN